MFDSLIQWSIKAGLTEPMLFKLLEATQDTILMSLIACFFGLVIGLPLGVLLCVTRPGQILEHRLTYRVLSAFINIMRSIPFIILIFWVSPLTSLLVNTTIGMKAVLVPLSIAAAPFIARMVENALLEIPYGLIEAAKAMGATDRQVITKVVLPEALPAIVNSLTLALITLVGYSAMGGALGAGGLGQLGYQYGHISYNPVIMNTVLILLILIVFTIQFLGQFIARKLNHR